MPTFLVPPEREASKLARLRAWISRRWRRGAEPRFVRDADGVAVTIRDRDGRERGDLAPDRDGELGRAARARLWLGDRLREHRRAVVKAALAGVAGIAILVAMSGTWSIAPASAIAAGPIVSPIDAAPPGKVSDPPPHPPPPPPPPVAGPPAAPAPVAPAAVGKAQLSGKLNLNTATAEQLVLLPTVGPSKAERIVTWRKRNGGFRRVADLRRVKGFGYKTFKKLEPYLAVAGDTTLARSSTK